MKTTFGTTAIACYVATGGGALSAPVDGAANLQAASHCAVDIDDSAALHSGDRLEREDEDDTDSAIKSS